MWFPISLFLFLSLLVSFTFTAGFAIFAAAVSLLFLLICFVHYPEEKPGGIDNPEGNQSIHVMMCVYAGLAISLIGASYVFPSISEFGIHNLIKF